MLGGWAGGASDARADQTLTVGAKGGIGDLEAITATFDGLGNQPESMLAGTLTGSVNGGAPVDIYCVDLLDAVLISGNYGTSSFAVNPLSIGSLTGGNGGGVGFVYDQFAPAIANEADGNARNIDGAALQVAIWKVEYDDGGALASGHFQMADSGDLNSVQHQVFARATQYLGTYDGSQSADATWYDAVAHPVVYGYSTNQNMVGTPTPTVTIASAAPEPSTLVLATLGAASGLAYALARRRRAPAPLT